MKPWMSPEVIYRVRRANDGVLRWIKRNANFVRGDAGTPMRMFGTVQDITEQKARERRSLALIELGDRLRDMIDTGANDRDRV